MVGRKKRNLEAIMVPIKLKTKLTNCYHKVVFHYHCLVCQLPVLGEIKFIYKGSLQNV